MDTPLRVLFVAAEGYPSSTECHVDAVTVSMQPAQFIRTATALLAEPSTEHLHPSGML